MRHRAGQRQSAFRQQHVHVGDGTALQPHIVHPNLRNAIAFRRKFYTPAAWASFETTRKLSMPIGSLFLSATRTEAFVGTPAGLR